jgi:hypothetical protein
MVIVVIIVVIAGLAGPGMMRGMAISRSQRLTHDLSRLGRRARAEAVAYGRAYMMDFNDENGGTFTLWRGITDSCRQNPWAAITAGGCGAGSPDCIDAVSGGAYSSPAHFSRLDPRPVRRLCFEPDGDLFIDAGGGLFVPATRTVRVEVQRFDAAVGTSAPVERRAVLFPVSAPARVER